MAPDTITQGTSFKELVGNSIPDEGRMLGAGEGLLPRAHYEIQFALENDPAKTSTMPTKGDKIGTITIDIDTK